VFSVPGVLRGVVWCKPFSLHTDFWALLLDMCGWRLIPQTARAWSRWRVTGYALSVMALELHAVLWSSLGVRVGAG